MSDNFPAPARPLKPLSSKPLSPAPSKPLTVAPEPTPLPPMNTPGGAGEFLGPNALTLLLGKARTPSTRKAYANNIRWFFRDVYGCDPDAAAVRRFLSQPQTDMVMQLAQYRQRMVEAGAQAATINLRLTAIRALVDMGHEFHVCAFGSKDLVFSAKARAYKDTRGPGLDNVKRLLALPDRTTLRGKRDFALLRLLADNALRRCEIGRLGLSDFEAGARRLAVRGKGQDDKEWLTLNPPTVAAIQEYLAASGHTDGGLFRNCAFRASAKGQTLTDDGLYAVIREYGKQIGLKLSPHKLRHFGITAALDKTGGDLRRVRKFSRHKRVDTVIIYDDNRSDHQGEITALLGDLLG